VIEGRRVVKLYVVVVASLALTLHKLLAPVVGSCVSDWVRKRDKKKREC
jgi:hypothetical protein